MCRARTVAVLGALIGSAACASAPAAPPAPPGAVSGAPAGFAQVLTARVFAFPQDHGPHPQFRQEWWYLTGNLDTATGERLGFELTFFRFALQPAAAVPPQAAPAAGVTPAPHSAWRTRQIYLAHFAITDVAAGRFRFAHKLSRDALGLAGAQSEPLRVWIDDWSLQGPEGTRPEWSLRAAQPGYQLELSLQPLTSPVLNGDAGLSRKSDEPGAASYYYSIPRLAARGRLIRDGHALTVQGLAWFDREWGSGELGVRQAGWDWFALQLRDGTALMFYALRERNGARDPHSAGTWLEASGRARPLVSQDVAIEVVAHWSDPHGTRYPAGWRIRVPALALELSVRPVLADQELTGTPQYWEGAVDVSATRAGQDIGGRGYVELVGYGPERASADGTGAHPRLGR